jgi:hypothetical protein
LSIRERVVIHSEEGGQVDSALRALDYIIYSTEGVFLFGEASAVKKFETCLTLENIGWGNGLKTSGAFIVDYRIIKKLN